MIRIRLQVKLLFRLLICLPAMTGATTVMADAQATPEEFPVELPQMIRSIEINLGNLFRESDLNNAGAKSNQDSPIPAPSQPIQLVGTLIMPDNKIAWIKTGEFEIHVLTEKQHVPGSQLKISRILTDSVELVKIGKCQKNSDCQPDLELDLN